MKSMRVSEGSCLCRSRVFFYRRGGSEIGRDCQPHPSIWRFFGPLVASLAVSLITIDRDCPGMESTRRYWLNLREAWHTKTTAGNRRTSAAEVPHSGEPVLRGPVPLPASILRVDGGLVRAMLVRWPGEVAGARMGYDEGELAFLAASPDFPVRLGAVQDARCVRVQRWPLLADHIESYHQSGVIMCMLK